MESDMTKALQAYSLINAAIGHTLDNDLASISREGSIASSKSHRSAAISRDGSISSFHRNSVGSRYSSLQSSDSGSLAESSHTGTSKSTSVASSVAKLPPLSSYQAQELRRQTIANKNLQSSNDFAGIINSLDELINSKALTDVLECGHIPLLKLESLAKNLNSRGNLKENSKSSSRQGRVEFLPSLDSSSIMGASSILKSLNSLPRTFKMPKTKISKKSKDDMRTETLNSALEYKKNAKNILDSSRLYFEAAILFDELDMSEHAIENFEKSSKRHDAALIVDTYDLPDSIIFQRKLERMSIYHKVPFLKARAEIREQLIFAEEERQRLRAIVSNCQLFRLYLRHSKFKLAYDKMNRSFKDCTSTVEHSEMLWYAHNILKDFVNSGIIEVPYFDQVEHSTGGPLAEAHIHILNELIEQDGTNPELFDYLGLRFAQRSEFEQSRLYYKRARELRDPQCDPDEMLERWKMRPERITEDKVVEAISKKYYLKYDNDVIIDEDIATNRQDYVNFNGTHKSSNTKLYVPPDQGWEPSVNSLLEKYSGNVEFLNTLVNKHNVNYVIMKAQEEELGKEKLKSRDKKKDFASLRNINTGHISRYRDII